jgi:HK97 family phage prohead protease
MTPTMRQLSTLSKLSKVERQLMAAQLGIAEQTIAQTGRRLAEASSNGNDEVLGIIDFPLEGKSMSSDSRGLYVEGYAAGFGIDRGDEAFEPGAFEASLTRYMATNPILCYHHKYDMALGVVEDAHIDSKGLFIRARLDEPEPGTVFADIYRKVKAGTIKGFSVGGRFKRRQTPNGPRIYSADLMEISVTPLPMEPGSLFAVAGKAMGTETSREQLAQLAKLGEVVEALERAAEKL